MMKKWAEKGAHAVEISALKFVNTPWSAMCPPLSHDVERCGQCKDRK